MTYEKEMAKYRSKATKNSSRRGRRKSDIASPPFFTLGFFLELGFLLLMGMWLLTACAKGAM